VGHWGREVVVGMAQGREECIKTVVYVSFNNSRQWGVVDLNCD